jgi:oligosaccharide repeat unit polymerase
MLAMLQRTNLFMAVLWYLAYIMSKHQEKVAPYKPKTVREIGASTALRQPVRPNKGLVVVAIAGAFVLLLAFQLMGSALGKTGQQALSTGRVTPVLEASGFSNVYVYATAGVPAFLKLVDSPNDHWPPERIPGGQIVGDYNPQTFGSATLGPLARFIPETRDWNPIAPFMNIGILTNVFTWYEHPYRDFRLGGVVAFSFVMGFMSTRMFTRRFRSPQLFWIQAAFFSTLFLSTFVAKTGTAIFWTGILYVALVARYNSRISSTSNLNRVSLSSP